MRRLLLIAAPAVIAALSPAVANAGLSNNPNALPFTLDCNGSQVSVLSPSPHAASGQIQTSKGEAIAYFITQTQNGVTTTLYQLGQGQRTGQAAQTTACTSSPAPGTIWNWLIRFAPIGG